MTKRDSDPYGGTYAYGTAKSRRTVKDSLFDPHPAMRAFAELPERRYYTADYVKPVNVKRLNKDNFLQFEITSQEDEYITFPADWQLYMEISPWTDGGHGGGGGGGGNG